MQVTDVSPNKFFCVLFLWLFLKGNSGHWASWRQEEVGKGVGQVAFKKGGVAL